MHVPVVVCIQTVREGEVFVRALVCVWVYATVRVRVCVCVCASVCASV